MPNWDFLFGIAVGFLVAGIFGYASQKRRAARAKKDKDKEPQSVTLKTEETPKQVVKMSQTEKIKFVFWTIALAAIVLFAAYVIARISAAL